MTASPAQMAANKANSAKSTGPKSVEGKERSRANSLKHGMTGAGVVLSHEDFVQVSLRITAFEEELKPTGPIGDVLVRRAAVCSVRMDRGVEQEIAALAEHVARAEAEFVPPENATAEQADRMRTEVGRRAKFDPSKEATLARKYEAWAERGFFKALKELRQIKAAEEAADPMDQVEAFRQQLGSILADDPLEAELAAMEASLDEDDRKMGLPVPPRNAQTPSTGRFLDPNGPFDVPFAIGRPR